LSIFLNDIYHSLSNLHGMTYELNFSVISITLNIPLFLKISTNILLLHSSVILLDRKMILNSLVSHTIATSLRHLHTSIGISSGPNALSIFIFLSFFHLRLLNSPNKSYVGVIKWVVQLTHGFLTLFIEQLDEWIKMIYF
jgi:hypothetical protein